MGGMGLCSYCHRPAPLGCFTCNEERCVSRSRVEVEILWSVWEQMELQSAKFHSALKEAKDALSISMYC
jgi:hypothetical protein